MLLKTSKGEKVTYSLICIFVFFVPAKEIKQKMENKKQKIKNRKKRKVLTMQCCKCTGLNKYANVSAYIPTFTDLGSPGA